MKSTDAPQTTEGFEQDLVALETLVERMEAGDLSLTEALTTFEQGVVLTRRCQQALQEAELKIQQLSTPDGSPETFESHHDSGQ